MNQNPHPPSLTEPLKRIVHVLRCDFTKVSDRFKGFEEYKTMIAYGDPMDFHNYFIEAVNSLGYNAKSHLVDLTNYKDVITKEIGSPDRDDIILNLCDGNDIDSPGFSVNTFLEQEGYLFYGVNSRAGKISASKYLMKLAFQEAKVLASPFVFISEWRDSIEQEIKEKRLKYPLLVKVDGLFSSMGLSNQSVVHDFEEVKRQVQKILPEYGSVVLEEFIIGGEFTCFIFEDENGKIQACPPLEKKFLVENPLHQWATFDMKWKHETTLQERNIVADAGLVEKLKDLSIRAYNSFGLNGYARIDLRMKDETGEIFVLEVNDVCELGVESTAEIMLKEIGKTSVDILSICIKNAKRATTPKSK